jgi:RNA polymerase primary sigma factor
MTLEEIGDAIGLTKERVRQIKEKALKKLRSEALNNSITADIYK